MNVLVTLTTAGTDTGPFDLLSNYDGYIVPIDGGISRAALVAGYTCTTVPASTTIIRVKSLGKCTTYVDISVAFPTTTTTSTTPIPTTTTTTTQYVPPITTTTTTTPYVPPITTTTTTTAGGGTTTTTTTSGGGTTTTTTTLHQYSYIRYDVSIIDCSLSNPTEVWAYSLYSVGFHYLNGDATKYYLDNSTHTNYTNEITSIAPADPCVAYYLLNACNPALGNVYTTLIPTEPVQLYINEVTFEYYTYNGSSTTIPQTVDGNIQKVTGGSGCPESTTTTTTPVPLTIVQSGVTCSGGSGDVTSTMNGGSYIYDYVAYDTSQSNVAMLINSGTSPSGQGVRYSGPGSTHNWTGLPNGTWYFAVKDSVGTVAVQFIGTTVSC